MSSKRGAYWAVPLKQLLQELKAHKEGFSEEEAQQRLKAGRNDLAAKENRHGLAIFFTQLSNPLILVLLMATILAYFLGETINAVVILLMVGLNVLLGFVQEYRAERTVRELRKFVAHYVRVLRDGELVQKDSRELVPGDIIYLSNGDLVPADIRLLQAQNLSVNEAVLTGESLPVVKQPGILPGQCHLPPQITNTVFMGTAVSGGQGQGIVVDTGARTFLGKTASYLNRKEPEAAFQKSLHHFSSFLLKVIVVMTAFIFASNAFLGKGYLDSFMFSLALAVGITPEILPLIMTITLSSGALRMAKEKVITKRLSSIEDLGNMDTLCCDKTGTLTEGTLELYNFVNVEGRRDPQVVLYGLLCTPMMSVAGVTKKVFENPIDKALWNNSLAKTFLPEFNAHIFKQEVEFDYQRRRMSVVVERDNHAFLIVKGAPEEVLAISTKARLAEHISTITPLLKEQISATIKNYERQGYKVIAVAEKSMPPMPHQEVSPNDENNLTLVGLLLFLDPPKKSAKEALHLFRILAVNVKVITGDSPIITRKVCQEVGVEIIKDRIITGDDLEKLSPVQWEDYCQKYNVFARITPEQKYKIVATLNKEGHIVGFLGDGVNDAPALRAADVGISVDTASGIAKEAADIILLNKNLHVVVDGIKQGRKVFGNITKYVLNTISANYGNMFTVAFSSLFMKFIPLLPAQILLNNFISDIPYTTVSTDNVDSELLHKPKRWNFQLISKFMLYFGLLSSFFDLALILLLLWVFDSTVEMFRTSWFVMSAVSEIVILFSLRTHLPFFRSRPSWWLMVASALTLVLAVALPYTSLGQDYFQFVPLNAQLFILIGIILGAYFIAAEIAKGFFFRRFGG